MPSARGAVSASSPALSVAASEQFFRSAFDRSPTGISAVGLDGHWLHVNDAYCEMLGYDHDDVAAASFTDFTHPDDVAQDRAFMAAAVEGGPESSLREKRYLCKDGSVVWASVRAELIRDEAGEPLYFVSHLRDISAQRAAQEHSRDTARTLRAVIDNTPAMIFIKGEDYRYQLVNREFERFYRVTRADVIGEGDEHVLPAEEINAVHVAERRVLAGETLQGEQTRLTDGEQRTFLTTRFPLLDDHGEIHALCVQSTDITEYRREQRAQQQRLETSEMIYAALAQDRFVLYRQPIVSLATMKRVQVELLIRMCNKQGGEEVVEPSQFLPAAERFDLIGAVDEWVTRKAIMLAAAGHRVAVNVSAMTMSDAKQLDRIERQIRTFGAAPENLVFEITETAVADNLGAARAFATRLRALGCAFALDDFGVGYAPFTYLRQLPVTYLKIDAQFVRTMLTDKEDRQIVQAIVGVAHQLQIETIAEGVEDQATLDELRQMGADHVQGFWVGRPEPLPHTWNR